MYPLHTAGQLNRRPSVSLVLVVAVFSIASHAAPNNTSWNEVDIRLRPYPPAGPVLRVGVPTGQRLDQNAAPLLKQAVALLKGEPQSDWFDELRDHGVSEEGEAVLSENREAMDKLLEAARCTKCAWTDPPKMEEGKDYRRLARLVCLKVRAEVAMRRYPQAAEALSAGYAVAGGMAGKDATFLNGLTGVAMTALVNDQAFWMLQQPGVPAVEFFAFPAMLDGLRAATAKEVAAVWKSTLNPLQAAVWADTLKASHETSLVLAIRVERQFDALRAVQALRESVAKNGDHLPETLPLPAAASRPAATPRTTRPASTRPATLPAPTYSRTSPAMAVLIVKLDPDDDLQQLTYHITLSDP